MGKQLCISNGHGTEVYSYEYTYTLDGKQWRTELFETLADARSYADEVIGLNRDNKRLMFYARRVGGSEMKDVKIEEAVPGLRWLYEYDEPTPRGRAS